MRNNTLKSGLLTYMMAAWMPTAVAAAQPNLADLLDKEDAAQPRPVTVQLEPKPAILLLPAGPKKEPIPSAAESQQANAAVQEIFQTEFAAANTPEKRVALAKQFLTQAAQTTKLPDRWAMLVQAVRLATEAGDAATTFAAIDASTETFDVDPHAARTEAIAQLVHKVRPSGIYDLAQVSSRMCRSSISQENLPEAKRLAAMTIALAKKSRNQDLLTQSNQLTLAIRQAEKLSDELDSLMEKHAKNPADAAVNLEVGRFYCFKADNWQAGLPFLAKGENQPLAEVAARELAGQKGDAAQLALADSWWLHSEVEDTFAKAAIQSHAVELYERVKKSLTGLEKIRVEKRINAAVAARTARGKSKAGKVPGLVLWLDAGDLQSFEPVVRRAVPTTQINVWRDLSGRGQHARQPDPAKQPIWSADAFDGSPGVVFSGGQTLPVPMPCGPAGTILVTLRPKATGNMRFLGCYRNQGEHVGLCLRSDGSVWAEGMMPGNAAAVARSNASAYIPEAKLLLGQSWGKSLSLIGAGRVPATPYTAGAEAFSGPWGVGGAFLKQQVEYFNGVIGEVLVFERELTASEIEGLWSPLAAKWRCR